MDQNNFQSGSANGQDQNFNQNFNQNFAQNKPDQGYNPNMGQNYNSTPVQSTKSKIAAGIFGIMWGAFGVHKFYLGYAAEGGIMLGAWLACFVLCFLTFGLTSLGCFAVQIIGLIEGIMYMTKSDEEFYQTYIVNKKGWF